MTNLPSPGHNAKPEQRAQDVDFGLLDHASPRMYILKLPVLFAIRLLSGENHDV